jgi:NAD(P)-dependent dehydrogenase (short-subunit alcohol dehydrogenase family)
MAIIRLAKSIAIKGKQYNILINIIAPIAAMPRNIKDIKDKQLRSFIENYMPSRNIAPTVA